jgi:hypothetical protein
VSLPVCRVCDAQPIVLAGVDLPSATAAICSVCPLDRFIDCPAQYMYPSPGSEVPRACALPVPKPVRLRVQQLHYLTLTA